MLGGNLDGYLKKRSNELIFNTICNEVFKNAGTIVTT